VFSGSLRKVGSPSLECKPRATAGLALGKFDQSHEKFEVVLAV